MMTRAVMVIIVIIIAYGVFVSGNNNIEQNISSGLININQKHYIYTYFYFVTIQYIIIN